MSEVIQSEVLQLPLWRNVLEDMLGGEVSYGKTYPVEYFEAGLRLPRGSKAFGRNVTRIRRCLYQCGFYLRKSQDAFVIFRNADNQMRGSQWLSGAVKLTFQTVTLLTNTKLDGMTDAERKRHQAVEERAAMRYALTQRESKQGKVNGAKSLQAEAKVANAGIQVVAESLEDIPKDLDHLRNCLTHAQDWLIEARTCLNDETPGWWDDRIAGALKHIGELRFGITEHEAEETQAKKLAAKVMAL